LVGKTPKKIRDAGVHLAFVPEDRLGMGLVGSMGMTGNMLLKSYGKGASPLTDMRTPKKMAEKVKEELEVVTPSLNTPVSRLSGGNVQKVLVGREIAEAPTVLMTAYAVRGLDINTSYTIYNLLDEENCRKHGNEAAFQQLSLFGDEMGSRRLYTENTKNHVDRKVGAI